MDRKDLYAFVMYYIDFEDYSDVSIDFEVTTPMFLLTFVMFLCFY
jgi:hypothetical protein